MNVLANQSLEPEENDNLTDELLASNATFQALVAESIASLHQPIFLGQLGLTNG